MIYAIPIAVFLGGAGLGALLARFARWGAFWAAVMAATTLAGWLFISARGKSDGHEAVATFLPALLLLAPLALGMLVGAAVLHLRQR